MADETKKDGELQRETGDLARQVEYLRELAQIVADEGLSQLKIQEPDFKITLKTAAALAHTPSTNFEDGPALVYAPQPVGPAAKTKIVEDKLTPIVSPMVGVFYRAPSPSDPNFIEIGDRVERGQTIGLVEAMKVFNEITAESAGVVAQIKAQTGQLVETGEALLLLK
ncbi:biotin carboxyl carrier protein [Abditibacterium utsteinense]|uniref:Biotin carboxyl carrier protein of acetyl-CoA carboxylase n=1 Tax=Abditibacterium utsteinense TaxID=1960156 RepID=A0A2S8STD8_9BACT|nr:acetyl-CoA carboxylase biotin carboxyl carrier protein [Abditibacterium utsteinense]PQV64046.1 biotin carboxyl carrier protein [Abditibacterium utsteinense]